MMTFDLLFLIFYRKMIFSFPYAFEVGNYLVIHEHFHMGELLGHPTTCSNIFFLKISLDQVEPNSTLSLQGMGEENFVPMVLVL